MQTRLRHLAALTLSLLIAVAGVASAPAPVTATGAKVAIIVGPTGAITDYYRTWANEVAAAAGAAGAVVAKAYSPNATWPKVRDAVDGANVVVYFGHGNGSPNPYSGWNEWTDRANGWGLNTATTNGDADSWSAGTLVYCGEKALLGTLTSSDGSAQWNKCGGKTDTDGIHPAPGFVMVYAQAHYAPGFGERYVESAPMTTLAEAQARVANYSYPVLSLGASAFFATAYGDADDIVSRVLTQGNQPFGEIFAAGRGYDASELVSAPHPDVAAAETWVQETVIPGFHFGDPDYWYAFAGNPALTPSGEMGAMPARPVVTDVAPNDGAKWRKTSVRVRAWFDVPVKGLDTTSFKLYDSYGFAVPARVRWRADVQRATLIPKSRLVPKEWYTARLSSAIRNAEGVTLQPYSWTFRTRNDDGDGVSTNWGSTTSLRLKQGTHTAYRFDSEGRLTSLKTASLTADSGAATSTLRSIPRQSGYWLHVTNGMWQGYWIRQSEAAYPLVYPVSSSDLQLTSFEPNATVILERGTHTAYRFSSSGWMTAEKTATLSRRSSAASSELATVLNQTGSWFKIVNGIWAGYWVRSSDVVHLPN